MRRIDPKFHIDGDKIVKTSNGEPIPDDEPLFLLRARDWLAVPLLCYYEELSTHAFTKLLQGNSDRFGQDGCTEDYHMPGLSRRIAEFKAFAEEHPERMKQPGITKGR